MVEETAEQQKSGANISATSDTVPAQRDSTRSVLSAPQVADSIHHGTTAAETKTLVSFSVSTLTGSLLWHGGMIYLKIFRDYL